ncbi:MAG: cytochrome c-type biogenesis protein CcmH [Proteobacteria bacterium]|nr:MAG: cytochrome c-type biogenesis protein CcmH [Pseudomonadota bacterium]
MIRALCFIVAWLPLAAGAAIESRQFEDPAQETRYFELIEKLRCLVCQNQNLADSNADLARDLRDKTYGMIVDGKSNDEITEFMVSRYGEFVLYEPPFNWHTMLLWLAPVILGIIGGLIFLNLVRNRRRRDATPVDAADLEAARELLKSRDDA